MPEKPETRLGSKIYLAIVASAAFLLWTCSGKTPPSVDVKIWQGDPVLEAIVRRQENMFILCQERQFRDFLCLTGEDLEKIYVTYTGCCLEWAANCPKMTRQEQARWLSEWRTYLDNANR